MNMCMIIKFELHILHACFSYFHSFSNNDICFSFSLFLLIFFFLFSFSHSQFQCHSQQQQLLKLVKEELRNKWRQDWLQLLVLEKDNDSIDYYFASILISTTTVLVQEKDNDNTDCFASIFKKPHVEQWRGGLCMLQFSQTKSWLAMSGLL